MRHPSTRIFPRQVGNVLERWNISGTAIRKGDTMLQRRIEQYLRRSGMKPARFGRNVVRDPRLVFDLRRGRELRPATAQRIRDWLDEQEAELKAAEAEAEA